MISGLLKILGNLFSRERFFEFAFNFQFFHCVNPLSKNQALVFLAASALSRE